MFKQNHDKEQWNYDEEKLKKNHQSIQITMIICGPLKKHRFVNTIKTGCLIKFNE